MAIVKIISLDGGGQLELTSCLLLEEIEKKRPGFLANSQILAGTSAGAMAALVLASKDDPADQLPRLAKLWEQFDSLTANSPVGTMLGLLGLAPVLSNAGLKEYLGRRDLLGTTRLGELKKLVVIPPFNLTPLSHGPASAPGRPKFFTTSVRTRTPTERARAVGLLAVGAAPVAFPIMDNNFIDGGAVANDPGVIAIAQVLHQREKDLRTGDTYLAHEHLRHIRMLSIGVGRQQTFLKPDNPNWGFASWLLNPVYPLLLIEAFSSGSDFAIRFVCERLLGKGYFRLNPYYATQPNSAHVVDTDLIRQSVAEPSTQAMVRAAVKWIDESGWIEDDKPRQAARATRKKTGVSRKTVAKKKKPQANEGGEPSTG